MNLNDILKDLKQSSVFASVHEERLLDAGQSTDVSHSLGCAKRGSQDVIKFKLRLEVAVELGLLILGGHVYLIHVETFVLEQKMGTDRVNYQ